MAALLKKRALAEYGHSNQVEEFERPSKTLCLSTSHISNKGRTGVRADWNPACLTNSSLSSVFGELISLHHYLPLTDYLSETVDNLLSLLQSLSSEESSENETKSAPETEEKNSSTSRIDVLRQVISILPEIFAKTDKNSFSQSLLIKTIDALCVCGNQFLQTEKSKQLQITSQQTLLSDSSSDESSRVLSKLVESARKLVLLVPQNSTVKQQVLELAINCLKCHQDHFVKETCLFTASSICILKDDSSKSVGDSVKSSLVGEITEALQLHATHHDNRVRNAAIKAMVCLEKGGILMPHAAYLEACLSLDDDYERVREAAIDLVKTIAISDGEREIPSENAKDEPERLADHAFFRICGCMNDSSVGVRVKTAKALCSIPGVSPHVLLQTLDKKLFSNMKRKLSYRERQSLLVSSGEWSRGREWGEDKVQENVSEESTSLTHSAGAFVHGLEDECQEVRSATLDALCMLAEGSQTFANQCLDFLVDMFNDEIDVVRLNAVQVLQSIVRHIRLQEDQLDEILHALKDSWERIRESVHRLLGSCRFSNTNCLQASVSALMENIRKYPQDVTSIQKCMVTIGSSQPFVVSSLVPQLLLIHPYFDAVQSSVSQPQYICKLLLILNAAAKVPTILPLLEEHTMSHYAYLRDTLPHLVPQLKLSDFKISSISDSINNTQDYLYQCLDKLRKLEHSSPDQRLDLCSSVYTDLRKLSAVDPSISAAADFAALYTRCTLLFTRLLNSNSWLTQESSGASVQQLVSLTFRLVNAFTGLSGGDSSCVRGIRLRALALQLVYVVNGSTGSALGLCEAFLKHARIFREDSELSKEDKFLTAALMQLKDIKRPGTVARTLQPLLLKHPPAPLPPIANPTLIKQASAVINSPSSDSDSIHKLTAGLLLAIPFDADLSHISDPSSVRIRISYPDQSTQYFVPRLSHMELKEPNCYRLNTSVLLTAGIWSEACEVQLSLVLDLSPPGPKRKNDPHTIELCDSRPLMLWPKPMRKSLQ